MKPSTLRRILLACSVAAFVVDCSSSEPKVEPPVDRPELPPPDPTATAEPPGTGGSSPCEASADVDAGSDPCPDGGLEAPVCIDPDADYPFVPGKPCLVDDDCDTHYVCDPGACEAGSCVVHVLANGSPCEIGHCLERRCCEP